MQTVRLTADELRALAADPAALEEMAERLDEAGRACTGVAASWCPAHGDCTCPEPESAMDHPGCPLHAPSSIHAD